MTRAASTSHFSLVEQRHTEGFRSVSLRGADGLIDPFLAVDLFHMSQPTFRPHPHAGFSAVTYLLPESAGSFRNRDSRGDVSTIVPGAVHWTLAGSGVVHEEVPLERGVDCWGLQIFVDLPAAEEQRPPWAGHAEPAMIPTLDRDGALVRVIAGEHAGVRSPIRPLDEGTPTFLDVTISAGGALALPTSPQRRTWLLVVSGDGEIDGRKITRHDAVVLVEMDGATRVVGSPGGLRVVVGSGAPLRQPRLWRGPFCMTTETRLRDAALRYGRGEMGELAASF